MNFYHKYNKYKNKYIVSKNLQNNSTTDSYNKIINVISNLNKYYKIVNGIIDNAQTGGGENSSKLKLKEYKKFIANAKQSIMYFKHIAEQYYSAYNNVTSYYSEVLKQLQIKKQEFESINNKLASLDMTNNHNIEKINMLESMMTVLEKLTKNKVNVDLDVKSTIGNKTLTHDIHETLQLGGMTYNEFDEQIMKSLTELQASANISKENNDFIKSKIKALNDRMRNIVDQEENIFNIRAKVEWIVDQLELRNIVPVRDEEQGEHHGAPPQEQDYADLYEQINGIIEGVKGTHAEDAEVAKYIRDLQGYATYLESMIKSNLGTLDGMSEDNKTKATEYAERLHGALNGGQVGGTYESEHNTKYHDNITTLKSTLFTNFGVSFPVEEPVEEHKIDSDMLDNYYGKYVVIVSMLKKLDYVIGEYKKYISPTVKSLLVENEDDASFYETWRDVFKNFDTTYYHKILGSEIIFDGYPGSYAYMLTTFRNPDEVPRPTTTVVLEDEYIDKLNNTITMYSCFLYFTTVVVLNIYVYNQVGTIQERNVSLTQYVRNLGIARSMMRKSYVLDTYNKFEPIYNEARFIGGGEGDGISLPESFSSLNLDKTDYPTFKEFFRVFTYKFNLSQGTDDIESVIRKVTVTQVKKTGMLIPSMKELVTKVNFKLGTIVGKSTDDDDPSITSFETLLKKVSELRGGSGAVTKPRLDPFKKKLEECLQKLNPILQNVKVLVRLMEKYARGAEITMEELKSLIKIYSILESQINDGINSYIKVIPMVFFTLQFPVSMNRDNCKYKFHYDGNEIVKYEYADMKYEDVCATKLNTLTEFHTHASFLDAGTKQLLEDPVIGLEKLIEMDSIPELPTNKVINMMIALGASGTGKTTRYFGLPEASDPNDQPGIITTIIKNALAKKKQHDSVSIAYFVCYGQKNNLDDADNSFTELLIFFNEDNNPEYTPYCMPPKLNEDGNYTDFYTKLVTRKLAECSYADVKNFVENGDSSPILATTSDKTFREILEEPDSKIWHNINSDDEATGIFEKMATKQKTIHTVLPTQNNIESSRGHTCICVRMNIDGVVKYFPLFDMAGTEDTSKMTDFLKTQKNAKKMEKFIKIISEKTIRNEITDDNDSKYTSLKGIIDSDDKIREYVIQTGGRKPIKISTLYGNITNGSVGNGNSNFVDKIIKEGYYVNHTIGMLIFAGMCVGESMQTTMENGNDTFDELGTTLFIKFKQKVCILPSDPVCSGRPRVLLDGESNTTYKSILEKSCIWLQILFSFLYWNEESEESGNILVDELKEDTISKEDKKYLCDLFSQQNQTNELIKIVNDENVGDYSTFLESLSSLKQIISVFPPLVRDGNSWKFKNSSSTGENMPTVIENFVGQDFNNSTRASDMCTTTFNSMYRQNSGFARKGTNLLDGLNIEQLKKLKNKFTTSSETTAFYTYCVRKQNDKQDSGGGNRVEKERADKALNDINAQLKKLKDDPFVQINIELKKLNRILNVLYPRTTRTEVDDLVGNLTQLQKLKTLKDSCTTNQTEINQMERIKDSKISAAKMTVMEVVSGQGSKIDMVHETTNLINVLWDATNISLKS